MEQIRMAVDAETYESLTAQKFNDDSLLLLEDSDLLEIGITAKGPRKLILSVTENLRATAPDHQDHDDEKALTNARDYVRTMLLQDSKYRQIVYDVLDRGSIPNENDIRAMVRIICKKFEKMIYDGRGYPTTTEQWNLAKTLIRTFPQLQQIRVNDNAPGESAFFWLNSGNEHGKHSGYIYHRVRNIIRTLPKEKKKFIRPQSTKQRDDSVPTSVTETAQSMMLLTPDLANRAQIERGLKESHPILELLLKEKASVIHILEILPHLRSYGGEMIHQAFYRLHSNVNQQIDFTPMLAKGLLLTTNVFAEVEDVHLRGILRIFAKLHRKGTGNSLDSASSSNEFLNSEEVLASPLIKWSTNILEAVTETMKYGSYVIAFEGIEISRDSSIRRIIDLYMKCFSVFGVKVPTMLQMFNDVVSILLYKTLNQSSRKAVNDLCGAISESMKAEGVF